MISDADQVRSSQTPHMRLLLGESGVVAGEDDGDEGSRLVMLAGNVDIRTSLRTARVGCKWNERFNGEKFFLASV